MSPRPAARCLVDLSAQARLRGGAPAGPPRLRILACPPSGAAAGYWRFLVRADVHVLGVQYPGRESRFREPAAPSLGALAAEAAASVAAAPWAASDVPLVVLGHSMGAAVAAELVSALEHEHGVPVALLALSAKAAPATAERPGTSPASDDDARLRAALDPDAPGADEALVRWLRGIGGTPEAVLANPELLALLLPVLRADLRLSMSHDRLPAPVRSPLLLLRGAEDATVDAAAMDGWRALTAGPVEHREYPGGHHPLAAARDRLLDDLAACARPAGPRRAGPR
ncbi:thioesterase II family protein [Kocuria sp. M1R5S2]|uniref:thioesterase II family protein n=1 Tax=Kocuria rhizosphaerae TaxID=3376285 RepID=UPI00379F9B0C